jgi:hypothetical protein
LDFLADALGALAVVIAAIVIEATGVHQADAIASIVIALLILPRTWKLLERIQPGLFSQLVVVPLFRDHRILSQVAGHGMNVVKALPPLVVSEEDLDGFVSALEETIARAERMPRALVRFALTAARAGRTPRRRLVRA